MEKILTRIAKDKLGKFRLNSVSKCANLNVVFLLNRGVNIKT